MAITIYEVAFLLMVAFMGFYVSAFLIGNISALLTNLDAAANTLELRLDAFGTVATLHELPARVVRRARQYFLHQFEVERGISSDTVAAELPRMLRLGVTSHRYLELLQRQPCLADVPPSALVLLAETLQVRTCVPGEYIALSGEHGVQLFVLDEGLARLVTMRADCAGRHLVHAYIHEGHAFGVPAFFLQQAQLASVQAVRFCRVLSLLRHDFERILAPFPQLAERMERLARDEMERFQANEVHLVKHVRTILLRDRNRLRVLDKASVVELLVNSNLIPPGVKANRILGMFDDPVTEFWKQKLKESVGDRVNIHQAQQVGHGRGLDVVDDDGDPIKKGQGMGEGDEADNVADDSLEAIKPAQGDGRAIEGGVDVDDAIGDLQRMSSMQSLIDSEASIDPIVDPHADQPSQPHHRNEDSEAQHPQAVDASGAEAEIGIDSKEDAPFTDHNEGVRTDTLIDVDAHTVPDADTAAVESPKRNLKRVAHFQDMEMSIVAELPKPQPFRGITRSSVILSQLPSRSPDADPIASAASATSLSADCSCLRHPRSCLHRWFPCFGSCSLCGSCCRGERIKPVESYQTSLSRVGSLSRQSTMSVQALIDNSQQRVFRGTVQRQEQRTIWSPQSPVFRHWQVLMFTLMTYSIFADPLRASFFPELLPSPGALTRWLIADYVLDIVFIIDMVLMARHFGFMELGVEVREPERIWAHYWSETFFIDALAALPVDFFALVLWPDTQAVLKIACLLRLTKLLRLRRLPERTLEMEKLLTSSLGLGSTGLRFTKVFAMFIVMTHVETCMWFAVSWTDAQDNWLRALGLQSASFGTKLLYAIYYQLCCSATMSYGDVGAMNFAETLVLLSSIFLSGLWFGAMAGAFETATHHADSDRNRQLQQADELDRFFRARHLPHALLQRAALYLQLLHRRGSKGVDEQEVLSWLPASVRMDFAQHVHRELIARVPLFQNCAPGFVKAVAAALHLQVFLPGDYIFRAGELGAHLYIIVEGAVDIVDPNGSVVWATLHGGEYFGEAAMLSQKPRVASARCQDFCDIVSLAREDFEAVLEYYPEYRQLASTWIKKPKTTAIASSPSLVPLPHAASSPSSSSPLPSPSSPLPALSAQLPPLLTSFSSKSDPVMSALPLESTPNGSS